jgi:hypothetical protein
LTSPTALAEAMCGLVIAIPPRLRSPPEGLRRSDACTGFKVML